MPEEASPRLPTRHWFRRHALAYGIVIGSLLLANIYTGGRWWSFWPMFGWGVLLAIHFLIVRALDVDAGWTEKRVEDLHLKSYDLAHVRDIGRRVTEHDPSVTPSDERCS